MKEIIIVIANGIPQEAGNIPKGHKVTIRDYDSETGSDESELKTDKIGDKYYEYTFY